MFLLLMLFNMLCFGSDLANPPVQKTVIYATTILKRNLENFAMEIAVRELDKSGKYHYFYACDAINRKHAIIWHGKEAKKEFNKLNTYKSN